MCFRSLIQETKPRCMKLEITMPSVSGNLFKK